ncbi:hypothetical protein PHLCEN_2v12093 [Hermanssonia centrifuga]|uniref:Phosphatidylinositol-specific phospholipase C X domain-containing protein n=1 Tax=Hermanssonia centrifuga TaxID=98765 RepID=A0A2R6NI06_9APHY|nr:hypothetical protein PHLCEN_2v12093 [Hermanssonia centrifuga]
MPIEDYCKEVDKQLKIDYPTVPKLPPSSSAPWYDADIPWPSGYNASWSPTVVVHLEQLWCVWSTGGNLVYSHTQDNGNWTSPRTVSSDPNVPHTTSCAASLVDLDDTLHLFFVGAAFNITHLQYDDTEDKWGRFDLLSTSEFNARIVPGVVAFQGCIYLTFLRGDNGLWWAYWQPGTDGSGKWSTPKGTGELSWGAAAFVVLGDELHILFTADNDKNPGRLILDIVFNSAAQTWSRSSRQLPGESSASGVACTITPQGGAVAFPANVTKNFEAPPLVCLYRNGVWNANEGFNQKTRDIPIPVVLDNILYCFWLGTDSRINYVKRRLDDRFLVSSWMSDISSSTKLENLCIPGTHDSGTSGAPILIETQTLTVADQLRAGVRFFDIRVGMYCGEVVIMHGSYVIDWTKLGRPLTGILGDIYNFLKVTPTETVIMTMMEQGLNDINALYFSLSDIFKANPQYWYGYQNSTSFPGNLGDARGKIVLVPRTTGLVYNWGFSLANGWGENDPNITIGNVDIQDYYNPSAAGSVGQSINDKWDAVNIGLRRGRTGDGKWHINFASANSTAQAGGHGPEAYAFGNGGQSGINNKLNDYFEAPEKGQAGTFPMDFPEYPNGDLITNIIEANFPRQ